MDINERASVIMMRGHGESRLRQAIMQGLVREEIAADVDEVLRQVESVKRDYDLLNQRYAAIAKELGEYKRIYFDAIKSLQKAKTRKTKWHEARSYAALAGIAFVIILLCTIICRAIFG